MEADSSWFGLTGGKKTSAYKGAPESKIVWRVRPNYLVISYLGRAKVEGVHPNIGMECKCANFHIESSKLDFSLKDFSLEMEVHFSGSVHIWACSVSNNLEIWSSKECSCGHQCGRTLHVGRGGGDSAPDFLFGEPWIDLSKNQVGDIGDVMINDYEYPINHPILLKKDGWVAPSFFFGWGASGCLHMVQGTLCGCQYGGWKWRR